MKYSTIILLAVLLGWVGLCAGCQGKFTRQRYETIHLGMQRSQVRKILGRPTATEPNSWTYMRKKPYHKATIVFRDEKVDDKSFCNERPRGSSDY